MDNTHTRFFDITDEEYNQLLSALSHVMYHYKDKEWDDSDAYGLLMLDLTARLGNDDPDRAFIVLSHIKDIEPEEIPEWCEGSNCNV